MNKNKAATIIYASLIFIVVVCMIPKMSYNDPDTFWHIELGKYMLNHGMVLHHAIHTFYNDQLPYVPHEFGFQIIIALLYMAFGWSGIYLLTAICMFLLLWGLYRLTQVSRKEMGLEEQHSVLFLFVLTVICFIYYYYFTSRPQMISSFLIVWFFIYLREFQMQSKTKYVVLMIIISIALANIHAGVWPVIAVFTGMAFIEDCYRKSLSRRSILTFILIIVVGLFNVGGLNSILYILTVTKNHFNLSIDEWKPIVFTDWINTPRMLLLLLFVIVLPSFFQDRRLFRYLFMLGILYLGLSSYKQNLFMWLFIPYFVAGFVDVFPSIQKIQIKLSNKLILICLMAGLSVNIISAFVFPTRIDVKDYPVEEMNYIMNQTPEGVRPKVLARYGVSGYVMFRGGDVLCDGRQDPFITDESKGVFGWTAFERSIYGFNDKLPDIVEYDHPDYVLTRNNVSAKQMNKWVDRLGAPVFTGHYGNVFLIK
jgi:hypothetical protein